MKLKRIKVPVVLLFVFFLVLLAAALSLHDAGGSSPYVGAEVCRGCHPANYNSYSQSIHAKKAIPGSPANRQACESCHGPGAAHVERGGGRGTGMFAFVRKAESDDKAARCLACHQESRAVPFWNLSRHKTEGVSCDNCHQVHGGARKNLKAGEPGLCNTCHLNIRSQENRQSHHPLKEGLMKCTQCHDQHGGFGPKMVKADSFNELCTQCHADKRGPFLWEHPPVEENCLNCHTPHGSNHAKLLNAKPPLLCQRCHDADGHPGNIYTRFETFSGTATSGKNRLFARACLNCHANIHGSMGPSVRGKRFVR